MAVLKQDLHLNSTALIKLIWLWAEACDQLFLFGYCSNLKIKAKYIAANSANHLQTASCHPSEALKALVIKAYSWVTWVQRF